MVVVWCFPDCKWKHALVLFLRKENIFVGLWGNYEKDQAHARSFSIMTEFIRAVCFLFMPG